MRAGGIRIAGRRTVRDIVQEGVAGADSRPSERGMICQVETRRGPLHEHGDIIVGSGNAVGPIAGAHHNLCKAVRTGDEITERIRGQQRHIVDVLVVQQNAELQRVGLDVGPGRHAVAVGTRQQPSRRVQMAVYAGDVIAQEHLMRGVRRIGLVLVDERRRRVGVLVDVVGRTHNAIGTGKVRRPRHHHELQAGIGDLVAGSGDAVRAERDQRIVGLQRDEDSAAAALGDEIKAVVEELAEEREPLVERRR